MPNNDLGNFLRERRMDLGLSQEQLAERIGGTASQAEISRLERGQVMLPRRGRMEALAAALDISLGALLVHSGWLTEDERSDIDDSPQPEEPVERVEITAIVGELNELRDYLLSAIERGERVGRTPAGHRCPAGTKPRSSASRSL
jgi:transcriptional regulator with XRE-family HTH domain